MSLPVAGSVSRPNLQSASFAKRAGECSVFFGVGDVELQGNLTNGNFHRR